MQHPGAQNDGGHKANQRAAAAAVAKATFSLFTSLRLSSVCNYYFIINLLAQSRQHHLP